MKNISLVSKITIALVGLLAIGSFALSYDALKAMALANGIGGWKSWVWPLLVDFSLVVFSLAVLRAKLQGEPVWYGWVLVGTYTLATIIFNVAHAPANLTARIIAGVAPVSLFLSFELLMSQASSEIFRTGLIETLDNLKRMAQEAQSSLAQMSLERDRLAAQNETLASQVDTAQNQLTSLESQIKKAQSELAAVSRQAQKAHADDTIELLDERQPDDTMIPDDLGLSPDMRDRWLTIMSLMQQGLSQAQIADQMPISLATVKRTIGEMRKHLNGAMTF